MRPSLAIECNILGKGRVAPSRDDVHKGLRSCRLEHQPFNLTKGLTLETSSFVI